MFQLDIHDVIGNQLHKNIRPSPVGGRICTGLPMQHLALYIYIYMCVYIYIYYICICMYIHCIYIFMHTSYGDS